MIFIKEKNRKLLEKYLRERGNRGYSRKTIKNYKVMVSCFLLSIREKDVTEVRRDDIERYLDGLSCKNPSKSMKLSSVKSYLTALSVFLSWLEDNELIQKNPARNIVKEVRVEKTKKRALSLKEVRRLVKTAKNPRDRAIILTMAIAGLRVSEVSNLKVGDVDFESLEMFVRQGKGRKDRIAIMDGELVEALKVWLIYRKSMEPKNDALFTNLHGNKPLAGMGLYLIVKQTAEKAGLKNVHPHKLRHSAATFMHDTGMDILEIKEQLGHNDIKTTEGYIDVNETKRKQGMNRMPSLNGLG